LHPPRGRQALPACPTRSVTGWQTRSNVQKPSLVQSGAQKALPPALATHTAEGHSLDVAQRVQARGGWDADASPKPRDGDANDPIGAAEGAADDARVSTSRSVAAPHAMTAVETITGASVAKTALTTTIQVDSLRALVQALTRSSDLLDLPVLSSTAPPASPLRPHHGWPRSPPRSAPRSPRS
jgi:prophage DNA circulation protein